MAEQFDVLVVGGGPAGTVAALSAARLGCRTGLLERNSYVGGVAVSGLPWHGFANHQGQEILTGIPVELRQKLARCGGATDILVCAAHGGYVSVDPELVRSVFYEELLASRVDVHLYSAFKRVEKEGDRISSVWCVDNEGSKEYKAAMVIDATGDGAVGASAGCAFEKGDGQGQMQPVTMLLRLGNVDINLFKKYIADNPEELDAHSGFKAHIEIDHILHQDQFIFIGLPKLIQKAAAEGGYTSSVDRISFTVNPVRGTVTINCVRQHGVDGTRNTDISLAEMRGHAQAMELYRFMHRYVPGFQQSIIICIGPQLGIRETRRFIGRSILTGDMVEQGVIGPDSVCLGQYAIDIHNESSNSISFIPLYRPFGIPVGTLTTPTCANLIFSGRNISTDRRAFAAMRVIGTCMGIGQASALLAAKSL